MTAAAPLSVRIAGCVLSLTTSFSSFSFSLDSTVQAVVVNIWKYNTSVVSPCVYWRALARMSLVPTFSFPVWACGCVPYLELLPANSLSPFAKQRQSVNDMVTLLIPLQYCVCYRIY